MDQLLLLYEVSRKQGYLKIGLQLQIGAISIDDVAKLFQTEQSSILSQNLEKDLENAEVAPFVFLVLIQFKDIQLPLYMQQCLAQTIIVGAVGIKEDGAPNPVALAEYVLLANKVDVGILGQVQGALVRRSFDTSGLIFQLIWLRLPETNQQSQNLLFHQLKSFLIANVSTTNLHKILIKAVIQALGDPMYTYITDIIDAFPIYKQDNQNQNNEDLSLSAQKTLLSWRDAIILTQIYDGSDSFHLLTKLSENLRQIPHNILLILLTAANLLPQLQLCVNNVSNKNQKELINDDTNEKDGPTDDKDSSSLQYFLKHENHYNKANQLIIQRVGEVMTFYDDQYALMLQKNLEIFYLPFITKNSGIFNFQLSNIVNQSKMSYIQNQSEYHMKLWKQYKFPLLTGLEQALGVLPNVFHQVYDVVAFDMLCKTLSSTQQELNTTLQRDKKEQKYFFPLLYTFGLLNQSIVIQEHCKGLLQLEDILTDLIALNSEIPNWPSTQTLYEDFSFRNVAVCRNFPRYEEILLQKYNKNTNDLIIDVFDVENEYISQLVDFSTSQEFYDSIQFFVFNLMINNDIQDQKTKNYVRAVLSQLLCGFYGEFKMSFFQIANQTVVTTMLQYLLLSIDPNIQLSSSFLYLILTGTNNSSAVFKELFKKGENGVLVMQILYKEHLQFLYNIESKYLREFKVQQSISILPREQREFGKRCCETNAKRGQNVVQTDAKSDLKYEQFNVFKIATDGVEWCLPLLTLLDPSGAIQLIAEDNAFQQGALRPGMPEPGEPGSAKNKLLSYVLGGSPVASEAEVLNKQLVEISFHNAVTHISEHSKDAHALQVVKAIFDKYNRQYLLTNSKLTVQTIKDLILYQDLLNGIQILKMHDISDAHDQKAVKTSQHKAHQLCELNLSIRNGILSLINVFSQNSGSQLYTQCLGLYLDNLYKYCNLIRQDQITNNLLQVISILMDKLLSNSNSYVSLQQINKIIQSLNYFDRIVKNSTYNNIRFDRLLDFYIVNTNKLNIQNDIIINFIELVTNMINSKFVFSIEQITKLMQYLYTKYDIMQNKTFINPLYNFLTSLEKNMLQAIYSSLQIRKNVLVGTYILLQELYLQLSENYETEKVINIALQYQNIYLMVLQQDMQHILNNQFIRSRSNTPNVHFTQLFNLALQKYPNTDNLNKFLSVTKCGAVFMIDFLQEYQIMDQIIQNVTDEKGLDNLYKIFSSGGTMPTESYEQMFQRLIDMDYSQLKNNEQYYNLMYKICLKLFDQEQYDNTYHLKYSNILNRQKEMVDFYQKTRNCRIQTLILLILSQLISKHSVDIMVKLAIQIAKQLDYEATSADKLQLCFMCHVKNVMPHNDHRSSQVLPAAYFKYIKEIKNQTV